MQELLSKLKALDGDGKRGVAVFRMLLDSYLSNTPHFFEFIPNYKNKRERPDLSALIAHLESWPITREVEVTVSKEGKELEEFLDRVVTKIKTRIEELESLKVRTETDILFKKRALESFSKGELSKENLLNYLV